MLIGYRPSLSPSTAAAPMLWLPLLTTSTNTAWCTVDTCLPGSLWASSTGDWNLNGDRLTIAPQIFRNLFLKLIYNSMRL